MHDDVSLWWVCWLLLAGSRVPLHIQWYIKCYKCWTRLRTAMLCWKSFCHQWINVHILYLLVWLNITPWIVAGYKHCFQVSSGGHIWIVTAVIFCTKIWSTMTFIRTKWIWYVRKVYDSLGDNIVVVLMHIVQCNNRVLVDIIFITHLHSCVCIRSVA